MTDLMIAQQIAQQIAEGDKSTAAIIVAIGGCGPHVWHILDSQPGRVWNPRRTQWHPWLRQVRNGSTARIFDAIHNKGDDEVTRLSRWKKDGRWHRAQLGGGRYVGTCEPRPGGLCSQWFVALCEPSGVVIDSTHTSHQIANTPRSAKAWARRWAIKKLAEVTR